MEKNIKTFEDKKLTGQTMKNAQRLEGNVPIDQSSIINNIENNLDPKFVNCAKKGSKYER